MGVMKRLYMRDGKGLPTDGPTVLRGPRAPAARVKAVPTKPEAVAARVIETPKQVTLF